MTTPEGEGIEWAYDEGTLLTESTWTGTVTADVTFGYDSNLRLANESIHCPAVSNLACNAVSYQYDDDDLLTRAGLLQLTRDPQNGLLQGTFTSPVLDSWTYNGHGETTDYAAVMSGEDLYTIHDERDGWDG